MVIENSSNKQIRSDSGEAEIFTSNMNEGHEDFKMQHCIRESLAQAPSIKRANPFPQVFAFS
jgi:hypothetical protein